MQKFFCSIILLFISIISHAQELSCPSAQQVKSVTLINAMHNKYDPDVWDFTSNSFSHDDNIWNVWFGTFLPDVKTDTEALRLGNLYFNNADVVNAHPLPVTVQGKIYCHYVPTGRAYWMLAISPPALGKVKLYFNPQRPDRLPCSDKALCQ